MLPGMVTRLTSFLRPTSCSVRPATPCPPLNPVVPVRASLTVIRLMNIQPLVTNCRLTINTLHHNNQASLNHQTTVPTRAAVRNRTRNQTLLHHLPLLPAPLKDSTASLTSANHSTGVSVKAMVNISSITSVVVQARYGTM
uniref:Uncharacterized protein n=1 Tax=Cacopsylla melanoneura TaxID=428564 RepID=A0A8D8T947_9HEMI